MTYDFNSLIKIWTDPFSPYDWVRVNIFNPITLSLDMLPIVFNLTHPQQLTPPNPTNCHLQWHLLISPSQLVLLLTKTEKGPTDFSSFYDPFNGTALIFLHHLEKYSRLTC